MQTEIATIEEGREIVIGDIHLRYMRADINFSGTITHTSDLSKDAADAMKEAAHSQFAVPAVEETKRAVEETKRTGLVAFCVVIAGLLMFFRPELGWPLALLVGVFGGTTAAPKIIDKLKGKPPV